MDRRALLIGSETFGLKGVQSDLDRMEETLELFDFEVEVLTGRHACRDGILESYETLVEDSEPGDAALLYYSGHGGFGHEKEGDTTSYHQFIVPTDLADSTEDSFRGVTSQELSDMLNRLTQATHNVTVVLDCCHSARMSRALDLKPRALSRTWLKGIDHHTKFLKERGLMEASIDGNPYAVRLVAAGQVQCAYEYTSPRGTRMGLFTEALTNALEDAKELDVTWDGLMRRIQEQVMSRDARQRPDVEGPGGRLLFGLDEPPPSRQLTFTEIGGKPALRGGRLLGVNRGDTFLIMPPGATAANEDSALAEAVALGVTGATTWLRINFGSRSRSKLPLGAIAFPQKTTFRARKIQIIGTPPTELANDIEYCEHLRVAEPDDNYEILASVHCEGEQITVRDSLGQLVTLPKWSDADGVHETVSNLQVMARAVAIREMKSGRGPEALNPRAFSIEWGRVVDGEPVPMPRTGGNLRSGDRIFVRLVNNSPLPLYFNLLNVGSSYKIGLLHAKSWPSGIEVPAKADYTWGATDYGELRGIKLSWSKVVPADGPRPETVLAFVTESGMNLSALRGSGVRDMNHSNLQSAINQIGLGGSRDLEEEEDTGEMRYAVHHIEFNTYPPFMIAPEPDPYGGGDAPAQLAVRLHDLEIRETADLIGNKIRVDAIALTGAPGNPDALTYGTWTSEALDVQDGGAISLKGVDVFGGAAQRELRVAVWLSRAQDDVPPLSELLDTWLASREGEESATKVEGGFVPKGTPDTFIRTAGAQIALSHGNSVGVFYGVWSAEDALGLGRHPMPGDPDANIARAMVSVEIVAL